MITARQAHIYLVWAKNNDLDPVPVTSRHWNCRFKISSTSQELGVCKERVRQVLAKIFKLLSEEQTIAEATKVIEKYNS